MTPETISSTSNPLLKRARSLRSAKRRAAEKATLAEGIAAVRHALDHARVETLIVAPDLLTSSDAHGRIEQAEISGTRVARITPEAFASIAERDKPAGLAAIVRVPERRLGELEVDAGSIFVVLVDVAGPGNLGTIVRTAAAVNAGVIVTGESTDPWHPSAVKASMGTVFSVPIAPAPSIEEVWGWCEGSGVTTVTTSARAETDYRSVEYKLPTAVVLGSERHGLDSKTLGAGDVSVVIPMEGPGASSLNLAVAAGILLYEMRGSAR